jgi:hypothetical protein
VRIAGEVEEVCFVVDDQRGRGGPFDLPPQELRRGHPLVGVELGRRFVQKIEGGGPGVERTPPTACVAPESGFEVPLKLIGAPTVPSPASRTRFCVPLCKGKRREKYEAGRSMNMSGDMVLAAVILLVGAMVLIGSWVIHWVLIAVGMGLIGLGLYIAFIGPVAGL